MSNLLAHSLDTNNRTKDVVIDENVTFESLLLSENILKGLKENGFKKPSPIQLKAIPVGRCGFDLLIKSKSGTGKTLVFAIIALETVNISQKTAGALIICPTREIAIQIQDVIILLGSYVDGLKVQSFIGGLSMDEDKEKCKACHIAVGTPGRIKHLITEKFLDVNKVRLLVLDEADKLMEDSFYNDVNEIYNTLPSKKQIITSSATYPNQLATFLSEYMVSPTQITAEIDTPLLLGLKHFIAILTPYDTLGQQLKTKTEEVYKILGNISFTQCMIFFNYQSRADSIGNFVNQKGFKCVSISSAKTQLERLAAIKELKEFRCRILMSTDLTSRGIDAENVDLVINYDIPLDAMTYLHRMGRAGRYGSTGVCINLACGRYEVEQLQTILGYIGGCSLSIPKLPNYCGTISNLVQAKFSPDDLIYGIVNKTPDLEVRNKMFDLKKIRDITKLKKPKTKPADSTKKSKVSNSSDLDHSHDSITEANFEAAGEDITKVGSSFENETSNMSMSPVESNKSDPPKCDMKKQKLDEVFCKNKALLDVTKLTSQPIAVDNSEWTSLKDHFNDLCKQEKKHISKHEDKDISDILDVLDNIDELNTDDQNMSSRSPIEEDAVNLENIFTLAYDSIVKENDSKWENLLSEFQNKCANIMKGYRDNSSDENNCSIEVSNKEVDTMKWIPVEKICQTDENKLNSPDVTECEVMKWVPAKKTGKNEIKQTCISETVERDVVHYEQFENYFENCSDHLWQNGLSFSDVAHFDEWYHYEWEAQMYAVRNYVQQNIYVQEMAKFQTAVNKNNTQ